MAKRRHWWLIWRRVACVTLLYAFVLAGFVENIVGPTVAAQSPSSYQELCLIDGAGGEPSEHRHSVDCCLHGCRIAAAGSHAAGQSRSVEWDFGVSAAYRIDWSAGRNHPPARLAAAGPFGARGPPLS